MSASTTTGIQQPPMLSEIRCHVLGLIQEEAPGRGCAESGQPRRRSAQAHRRRGSGRRWWAGSERRGAGGWAAAAETGGSEHPPPASAAGHAPPTPASQALQHAIRPSLGAKLAIECKVEGGGGREGGSMTFRLAALKSQEYILSNMPLLSKHCTMSVGSH